MIIMFPDHPNTVGSLLLPRCTAPLLLLWIMLLSWWQFPPRHLWTATIIEVSPCTGQSLFHWSSQLAPDACSTNGILQRFASRKNSKRPVSFPYVSSLRSMHFASALQNLLEASYNLCFLNCQGSLPKERDLADEMWYLSMKWLQTHFKDPTVQLTILGRLPIPLMKL